MIGIYSITSPSGRIYIGQSKDIEKRFKIYRKLSASRCQPKLHHSFLKYGISAHRFAVLEVCEISELDAAEELYIDLYDTVKNGLNCANGARGGKHTETSRAKISAAMRAISCNPAVKERKSRVSKSMARTPEHCERIREGLLRHWKTSPRKLPPKVPKKFLRQPIQVTLNGAPFCACHGVMDAARMTGCDRVMIRQVLKGLRQQTGGGFVFQWL